jgi:prepilin-type N-terminal cleavage/methylation domain-containing protein
MQATLERLRARRDERGDEGGFTLIELLIVIVILAILAAIVVFAVQNLTGSSAKASCESDVQTVDHASQAYLAQVGTAPTNVTNLTAAAGSVKLSDGSFNTGPWLHNTPTNGTHYSIILTDGNTAYNGWTVGGAAAKAPAGIPVVETFTAGAANAAPLGTLYNPPGPQPTGVTGPVTTPSEACAGVTG